MGRMSECWRSKWLQAVYWLEIRQHSAQLAWSLLGFPILSGAQAQRLWPSCQGEKRENVPKTVRLANVTKGSMDMTDMSENRADYGMIRFATKWGTWRILKAQLDDAWLMWFVCTVISRIHVPDVMTSSLWTGVSFYDCSELPITISGFFLGVIYACNEIVWKLPLESFGLVWLWWPLKRRSDSSHLTGEVQGFGADSQEYPCWLFFGACATKAYKSQQEDFKCTTIWVFHGVSKNTGTPKWMVYNGKPY